MDRFDKAILAILQQDATLPVTVVANRVGLSKSACGQRIQKLEKSGVITARLTLLDSSKLNLPLTTFLVVRTNRHDPHGLDKFERVVKEIPEVLEIHRLFGDMDYLIKAVVTDMDGYSRLYKQLNEEASLYSLNSNFVMETVKNTTNLPLKYV